MKTCLEDFTDEQVYQLHNLMTHWIWKILKSNLIKGTTTSKNLEYDACAINQVLRYEIRQRGLKEVEIDER